MDLFEVICPYCFETMSIEVEMDVAGGFVQDCEVCCQPWQIMVSGSAQARQIDVQRAQ